MFTPRPDPDADVLEELVPWLRTYSREEALNQDAALLNLDRWNRQLRGHGTSIQGIDSEGSLVDHGAAYLTRKQLFAKAPHHGTTDPFEFLLHVLVWESATIRRRVLNELDQLVRARFTIGRLLLRAQDVAKDSPGEAYALLRPSPRSNTITNLGPSSFSKVLYFSGAGNPNHPALIVNDDAVTRRRYEADLARMHDLAASATQLIGRTVAPDEVEMWATNRRRSSA